MHFQEKVVKVCLVAGGLALSFRQTVTVRSQPATSYMRQTIFVHNLSARSSGVGKKISPTKKVRFCCIQRVDKAPRLSLSIVIWILSSDTICQLNQFNTNSEAAMLSTRGGRVLT